MIQKTQNLLKLIEDKIASEDFGAEPAELYEPIRYIMQLGGKRVRPLMTLMAYSMYRNNPEDVIDQAISVELFHNFTLVHDDIMDEAPLRRGNQTVHEKWDTNVAILSGDVMLVKVYEFLIHGLENSQISSAIEQFNRAAIRVCEGQQMDMNFENNSDISEEEYIKMIRFKTAELLAYSLSLGALLAGEEEDAGKLYDIGINAGIGFQLKDDLLDVWGGEEFGKQTGGDILANKKTFLTIKSLELLSEKDRKILNKLMNNKADDPDGKIASVKAMYEKCGVKEKTSELIDQYFEKSFKTLRSLGAPMHRRKNLREYLEFLINRTT